MSLRRLAPGLPLLAIALAAGCLEVPGWDPNEPTRVVCGCHSPEECYEGAASTAKARGETAESGEELLYFAQCACFQGSMAGCNTLGHFSKDFVRDCDADRDPRNACTIAGFVHRHGVNVPQGSGRAFPHDEAAAQKAFAKGCEAGADVACRQLGGR